MRISGIEALHLRLPSVQDKADGTQEVLIARVTTDMGLVGHGEAVSCSTVARAIIEAPRSAPFSAWARGHTDRPRSAGSCGPRLCHVNAGSTLQL